MSLHSLCDPAEATELVFDKQEDGIGGRHDVGRHGLRHRHRRFGPELTRIDDDKIIACHIFLKIFGDGIHIAVKRHRGAARTDDNQEVVVADVGRAEYEIIIARHFGERHPYPEFRLGDDGADEWRGRVVTPEFHAATDLTAEIADGLHPAAETGLKLSVLRDGHKYARDSIKRDEAAREDYHAVGRAQ